MISSGMMLLLITGDCGARFSLTLKVVVGVTLQRYKDQFQLMFFSQKRIVSCKGNKLLISFFIFLIIIAISNCIVIMILQQAPRLIQVQHAIHVIFLMLEKGEMPALAEYAKPDHCKEAEKLYGADFFQEISIESIDYFYGEWMVEISDGTDRRFSIVFLLENSSRRYVKGLGYFPNPRLVSISEIVRRAGG